MFLYLFFLPYNRCPTKGTTIYCTGSVGKTKRKGNVIKENEGKGCGNPIHTLNCNHPISEFYLLPSTKPSHSLPPHGGCFYLKKVVTDAIPAGFATAPRTTIFFCGMITRGFHDKVFNPRWRQKQYENWKKHLFASTKRSS